MRKREGELPAVTDGECTIPSYVVQVDACNGSLRSKRFQSSYCAKVGCLCSLFFVVERRLMNIFIN